MLMMMPYSTQTYYFITNGYIYRTVLYFPRNVNAMWNGIEHEFLELSRSYLRAFQELDDVANEYPELFGIDRMILSTMTLGAKLLHGEHGEFDIDAILERIFCDETSPFSFPSSCLPRLHKIVAGRLSRPDLATSVIDLGKSIDDLESVTIKLQALAIEAMTSSLRSVDMLDSMVDDDMEIMRLIRARKKRMAPKKITRRSFKNQFTVYLDSVALFVFKKGSLHSTGCKSVLEFINVVSELSKYLDEGQTLGALTIKMINFNMCCSKQLSQRLLVPIIRAKIPSANVFISDTHPPINIKCPSHVNPDNEENEVTCLIHASGAIALTALHPLDISRMVRCILEILAANPGVILGESKKQYIRTNVSTFAMVDGYPSMFYDQCTA